MMSTIRQCLGADISMPQLTHQEFSQVPAKQIHRWEDEGGFIPPETLRPGVIDRLRYHENDCPPTPPSFAQQGAEVRQAATRDSAASVGNASSPDKLLGISQQGAKEGHRSRIALHRWGLDDGPLRWSCRGPTMVMDPGGEVGTTPR